jgi:hypothetical protein
LVQYHPEPLRRPAAAIAVIRLTHPFDRVAPRSHLNDLAASAGTATAVDAAALGVASRLVVAPRAFRLPFGLAAGAAVLKQRRRSRGSGQRPPWRSRAPQGSASDPDPRPSRQRRMLLNIS